MSGSYAQTPERRKETSCRSQPLRDKYIILCSTAGHDPGNRAKIPLPMLLPGDIRGVTEGEVPYPSRVSVANGSDPLAAHPPVKGEGLSETIIA